MKHQAAEMMVAQAIMKRKHEGNENYGLRYAAGMGIDQVEYLDANRILKKAPSPGDRIGTLHSLEQVNKSLTRIIDSCRHCRPVLQRAERALLPRACLSAKAQYLVILLDSHLQHIVPALDAQFLIDLVFDGQPVTVPAPLALHVETVHVSIPSHTILPEFCLR